VAATDTLIARYNDRPRSVVPPAAATVVDQATDSTDGTDHAARRACPPRVARLTPAKAGAAGLSSCSQSHRGRIAAVIVELVAAKVGASPRRDFSKGGARSATATGSC
jgi:hypothetical protein